MKSETPSQYFETPFLRPETSLLSAEIPLQAKCQKSMRFPTGKLSHWCHSRVLSVFRHPGGARLRKKPRHASVPGLLSIKSPWDYCCSSPKGSSLRAYSCCASCASYSSLLPTTRLRNTGRPVPAGMRCPVMTFSFMPSR